MSAGWHNREAGELVSWHRTWRTRPVDWVVVSRDDAHAERVETLEQGHRTCEVAVYVSRLAEHFVADAPDDNRRVVPIATHQQANLLILPVSVVFVPDKKAQSVCSVEERWGGGVVSSSPCIHSHLLQLGNAVHLEHVWHGDADARKVLPSGQRRSVRAKDGAPLSGLDQLWRRYLVVGAALNFDGLAIQGKTRGCTPGRLAEANSCAHAVTSIRIAKRDGDRVERWPL